MMWILPKKQWEYFRYAVVALRRQRRAIRLRSYNSMDVRLRPLVSIMCAS
jgi:hypothetical protein